jgi:hypothetical protein
MSRRSLRGALHPGLLATVSGVYEVFGLEIPAAALILGSKAATDLIFTHSY